VLAKRGDTRLSSQEKGTAVAVPEIMWQRVGLFRDAAGLNEALERFGSPLDDESSVLTVGRLIARAALRREESRGGHYRLDFPKKDDAHWKYRIMESANERSE